jgi:hypothetical protein
VNIRSIWKVLKKECCILWVIEFKLNGGAFDGSKIVIFIERTFMEKNSKGLADAQEGEFILNESGTSVSIDPVEGVDIPETTEDEKDKKEEKPEESQDT